MGIDVFEETEKFQVFTNKLKELEKKEHQLETNLKELNNSLIPFASKKATIHMGPDSYFSVTRKSIRLEQKYHVRYISQLDFFKRLNEIDLTYVRQLSSVVRKQLREYLYPYLQEGMKLKVETIIEQDVPTRPIKLYNFFDELKTIYVSHLKMENSKLKLLGAEPKIVEEPFKWGAPKVLNALAIAQQYPEIFDFYRKGLENYDKALDYNFTILKNMEQIISPFVIAKRMGRKIGR
jgi:hypothetical protein